MTPLDGTVASYEPVSSGGPDRSGFLRDAMAGLRASPKHLSPKYFYDTEGSVLFDAICELPEYYVTRTELGILEARAAEIATSLASKGPVRVVEPGAGSGTKTRLLLRALGEGRCVGYVPVDIAGEHLEHAAAELRAELPWLRVTPFAGDFSLELPLPTVDAGPWKAARTVVYFPGSTLGNFDPEEARRLLARFRHTAGPDGAVLLGVDLKKDPAELHAAYNDAQGVTAAFNKNVLRRMNRELGADFDVAAFHHYAFYEPLTGRIEMHLVSAARQEVHLGGEVFSFEQGESLCTEHSYKFDLGRVERLARSAGLTLSTSWLDDNQRFAVLLLERA
jgi:L-histidine N-alpha-methyltransferase